jgi:hypothetical protein
VNPAGEELVPVLTVGVLAVKLTEEEKGLFCKKDPEFCRDVVAGAANGFLFVEPKFVELYNEVNWA